MSKVVPFRRPPKRSTRSLLTDYTDESSSTRHLWVHVLLFSAIALVMYTAAVLAIPGDSTEKLWLIWLVFVIAATKLIIANGLIFAMTRSDSESEAARKLSSTRRLAELPRHGRRNRRSPALSRPRYR